MLMCMNHACVATAQCTFVMDVRTGDAQRFCSDCAKAISSVAIYDHFMLDGCDVLWHCHAHGPFDTINAAMAVKTHVLAREALQFTGDTPRITVQMHFDILQNQLKLAKTTEAREANGCATPSRTDEKFE